MLSVKASWSGRTFALARCSDVPEKKTRRRITKERRRTMVESFIKKYQGSNNGDFPSLNLTHKEVGGSFYTVREIVRELIQENKVLRPGKPSSTSLSLEDYWEEYPVGSLSMAPHVIDQEEDCLLLSSENQILKGECYDVVASEPLDLLSSYPNGCPDSPVMHVKSSEHMDQNLSSTGYLDEGLINVYSKEEDSKTRSGETDDLSGTSGYMYSEVVVHNLEDSSNQNVEQLSLLGKPPLASNYTSSELGKNEELANGSQSETSVGQTKLFAESNGVSEVMGQEVFPEITTLSNSGGNDLSSPFQDYSASATRKNSAFASTAAKTSGLDRISVEVKGSLEAVGINSSPNEMEAVSMQAGRVSTGKRIEPTENLSSSQIKGEATELLSPISLPSETAEVELQSGLRHADGVDKIIESHPSKLPSLDAKGPRHADDIDKIIENYSSKLPSFDVKGPRHADDIDKIIENHSSKLPSLDAKGPSDLVDVKDEDIAIRRKTIANRRKTITIRSSSTLGKAGKEFEKKEVNPVWAALKAFVDSVIKFWSD